jgi:hypothetical protein
MAPTFSLKPSSETIQPVLVVPTLAPTITPSAAGKESSPALTKPMVVMVVALEDWTSAVSPTPERNAAGGVPVAHSSTRCNELPAAALRLSDIRIMPTRKRPTPPSRVGMMVNSWSISG